MLYYALLKVGYKNLIKLDKHVIEYVRPYALSETITIVRAKSVLTLNTCQFKHVFKHVK